MDPSIGTDPAPPAAGEGPSLPPVVRIPLPAPPPGAVCSRLAQGVAAVARHVGPVAGRRALRGRPARRPALGTAGSTTVRAGAADALRAVFDDLGGTFTKFGQLIGSAPSLFGDDVAAAFRGCLDAGPQVPFADVRAQVERELGGTLETRFAEFDEVPMAAASLAVVHRAVLPDGTAVAVKVLRPGIETAVATDIAIMRPLFGFVGRQIAVGMAATLPGLIEGLEEQITEEVDLRNEALAMQWFARAAGEMGLDRVRIPSTVATHSSRRVLTMELLDGRPIDDLDHVERIGIDIRPGLEQTLKAWFATTLVHGVFHGDIHAGNLLVLTDGSIGVLDWGIVGRLDAETHRFFRRMVEATLGDEAAWDDVHTHLRSVYGTTLNDALGLDDAQVAALIRGQVEAVMTRPFGEVDLRMMMMSGPDGGGSPAPVAAATRTRRERFQAWREQRAVQRAMQESQGRGTAFDRATFLLSKQLVYLDRYGKMYLPDTPLIWDPAVFHALLAEPVAGADPA
ncbi:MAG TPA: AarF/ABC1/UbiB kinase family protein [Acidimicrobiales bacterium]|nr:AarF/ABC1/UbiB kinase family protein [Acidimicrobiales bacterium]